MKKILVLLLVLSGISLAQDTTYVIKKLWTAALTASRDTIVIKMPSHDYIELNVWTSTGTDSVYVDTKRGDDFQWVQRGLIDMQTKYVESFVSATTTKKAFIILDPDATQIRLRCPDVTVNTTYEITGKGKRIEQ